MSTEEFAGAWKELSQAQRGASEWNKGPVLVLAGPGSGKTRVLTCRIARILDSTRDENFRVLGLTFTNKAADEMRTRVEKYVPGLEGRVFLGTFHSFCADVLRQHGTYLGIKPNFTIYSQENELQELLDEAIDEARKASPAVQTQQKRALQIIARLKSLLISPADCEGKFADPNVGKAISAVYASYEAQLAKRNALDFNSLIFGAYQLFRKFPAFARRYRAVYAHVCLDEFQDTNLAQYGLLRELCGDVHRNLFVVADDDQIIYQWNGASHKRINQFLTDYSSAVIQLPTNYRCPPEVVRLANSLIQHNFLRLPGKEPALAFRSNSVRNNVRLLSFLTIDEEVSEIAKEIRERHSGHFDLVAILARSRRLLDQAHRALLNLAVPAVIAQRKDEFQSFPLVCLHSILRLENDRLNRICLETVCGAFKGMTSIASDVEDIVTQARATDIGYLHQWVKDLRREHTQEAGDSIALLSSFTAGTLSFLDFSKYWLQWVDQLATVERVVVNPSVGSFDGYQEERSAWNEIVSEVTRLLRDDLTLEAFLQEMEMRSKESPAAPNHVVLMTIHGAKGKEFDHVYLIGAVEDEIPSYQSKQKGPQSAEVEEERRNCFVAITRTIETLTISYSDKYWGWSKRPSRFLYEMGLLEADLT